MHRNYNVLQLQCVQLLFFQSTVNTIQYKHVNTEGNGTGQQKRQRVTFVFRS